MISVLDAVDGHLLCSIGANLVDRGVAKRIGRAGRVFPLAIYNACRFALTLRRPSRCSTGRAGSK